jgi:hypothetical protein
LVCFNQKLLRKDVHSKLVGVPFWRAFYIRKQIAISLKKFLNPGFILNPPTHQNIIVFCLFLVPLLCTLFELLFFKEGISLTAVTWIYTKKSPRATPEMFTKYRLALLQYKTSNERLQTKTWIQMKFYLICVSRQTTCSIKKDQ